MTGTMSRASIEGDVAVVAFMHAQSLCSGLPEDCFSALCVTGTLVDCAPGDAIVREGAGGDALYVVFEGAVALQKGSQEVALLERQAVFGEAAVLTQQLYDVTVQARTHARLICLPGDAVRAVAERAPRFGRMLAALMAGRSREIEKKVGGS
jgi:CRP-like cAMP-binding protein